MKYTFGTDKIGENRLKSIAYFFNPLAKKFIKKHLGYDINNAIDLGCGPGFTTKMLSEIINCNNIIGFDNSRNFIKTAKLKYNNLKFILYDVTKIPFPIKADLMYCRFLLSHLPDVLSVVNNWIEELNKNGKIFIDEVEDVITEKNIFKRYLKINSDLIKSQNAKLFIGKILANMKYNGKIIQNTCNILPVNNWQAASWFYPNSISIWEKEKYILNNISKNERKEIASGLKNIMESKDNKSDIVWKMRRIVVMK